MVNLKAYIEKKLSLLNQTAYLKHLKIDKIIRVKGFETAIVKTIWGFIVFQSNGKGISETWLTLSEILAMAKLHDYILKPIDIDLNVIA